MGPQKVVRVQIFRREFPKGAFGKDSRHERYEWHMGGRCQAAGHLDLEETVASINATCGLQRLGEKGKLIIHGTAIVSSPEPKQNSKASQLWSLNNAERTELKANPHLEFEEGFITH